MCRKRQCRICRPRIRVVGVAMGARVSEVPLKRPISIVDMPSHDINAIVEKWSEAGYQLFECIDIMNNYITQQQSITTPPQRKNRAIGMVALPWGRVRGIPPICMDNNDPDTTKAGLLQRLVRVPPMPNKQHLADFSRFVQDWVTTNIPHITIMPFEEWLEGTNYNTSRRESLRNTYSETRGVPSRKQCCTVKTHVKREDYPTYKHARTINSRSDAFKCFAGPIFKSIEKVVYDSPYFVKHMTPEQRAQRISTMNTTNMHVYASDYTAFESHFTKQIQESCEMHLYAHCLANYPHHFQRLHHTLTGRNKLRTRNGLRATVSARRMSGEMNTSLGNGFTNLMVAMYLTQRNGGKCFDAVIEGDDALIVTDTTLTKDMYENLGFTVKLDEVKDVRTASFCGLIFSESGETIKDPVRFLQHFGWTDTYLRAQPNKHFALLHAKALSALHELPQCPIVGAVCRYAMKISSQYPALFTDTYLKRLYDREWVSTPLSPSQNTRLLFERMFKVPVQQQLDLEEQIAHGDLTGLSSLQNHPHLGDYEARFVEEAFFVG